MRIALLAATFMLASGLQAQVAKPIPDHALGLSRGSVFDVPSPPLYKEDASEPGAKPVLPRVNVEFPLMISHGTADFLPITRTANSCVDCHDTVTRKEKGDPTPVPASHYVDLRRAPGKRGSGMAGARWVCTACHVSQTDAKPLVGLASRF